MTEAFSSFSTSNILNPCISLDCNELEELGINYYNARWYGYVNSNPIRYIDPTGLEMQIAGSASFKQTALADMQKLTRDTLDMRSDGTVIITNVSDSTGTLDSGTELIRRLNTKYSVTGREKDKHIITIVEDTVDGNIRRNTDPTKAADTFNGTGAASTIGYDPNSNPLITTRDSNSNQVVKAIRPTQIGLGHELIHADHAREGDGDGHFDPLTGVPAHDKDLLDFPFGSVA